MATPASTAPAAQRNPRRRGLGGAVAGAVVGAALTATASTQTWLTASGTASAPGGRVSGSTVAPLVLATGLVGLAAAGAVLATAGVLRRILGVLVTVLAAGALASAGAVLARPAASYRGSGVAGVGEVGSAVSRTAWPFLSVLGLLLLAGVGVATAVAGGTWPGLGRRYQAPRAGGPPERGTGPGADWDDLDAGRDPTLIDPAPDPAHNPEPVGEDGARPRATGGVASSEPNGDPGGDTVVAGSPVTAARDSAPPTGTE